MAKFKLIATALFGACSMVYAQDVLLIGRVQRVILQPSGTENCPPPCPAKANVRPDGTQTVCVSNQGGCETMEVKVDHIYRGVAGAGARHFKSRIGEFGPSFPVTEKPILVSEEAGKVSWSPVIEKDGRIFIDPKRLRSIGGIPTSAKDDGQIVELDEVLARTGTGRRLD